ncbi:MAG: hypothetical protein QM820_09670 [Minicystis sp.]
MSMRPSIDDERATAKPVNIPTVIAAGCSDVLLARCWNALAGLAVMVRDCDLGALPTLAAARQPLAIVVPSAIYAADPEELDALARDVRATLIEADERSGARDLESTLSLVVRAALRRREDRPISGRYSILPGDPIPGLASCPPVSGVQPSPVGLEDLEEELLSAVR